MLCIRSVLGSLVLLLIVFGTHHANAQELKSGPQVLTFF
jgi:hypothetical protein